MRPNLIVPLALVWAIVIFGVMLGRMWGQRDMAALVKACQKMTKESQDRVEKCLAMVREEKLQTELVQRDFNVVQESNRRLSEQLQRVQARAMELEDQERRAVGLHKLLLFYAK